ALKGPGAKIVIANRTRARAEALAAAVGGRTADWGDRDTAAAASDLIIQATSIGMSDGALPLTPRALEGRTRYVLDLVYGPDETPLVRAAREKGIAASDGLSMLVHQAAEAWRLFFGGDPPLEAFRRAANAAAAERRRMR
ncbi:MAG: shikimate dehydrogenase, partial [Actinomycetota bacterium]